MFIRLPYPAVCWLISVVFLTLANPAYSEQPLVKKTLVRSGEAFKEIPRLNQLQLPKTNASYLWRVPRQNKFPELSQATTDVVLVTDVKVNSTDKGIELILVTANSLKLQVLPKIEGNSYIADIPNAKLQLRSGDFRQEKPVGGIAEVTVANLDANTLRVTVTGEAFAPVVELFDSTKEGLVFGVTPSTSTAQQPTTTPEQKPSTIEPEKPIELIVTAPPDTSYRIPDATTATKTDTPLRDIPASVQVIPQQVIEDQQPRNLIGILRNAGVVQNNFSSRIEDTFLIRGFTARNVYRNGVKDRFADVAAFSSSLTNIDRVELVRGPNSVIYGQVNPGGIINIVTKKPLSQPYYALEVRRGGYELFEPSLDLSSPLTKDGSLSYRLNTSYRTAEDFTDFYNEKRFFVSPVINWRIGKNTNLTFDSEYEDIHQSPGPDSEQIASATILPNPNGKIPINRYLGEPTDFFNRQLNRYNYNLEHRFNDNWSISNSFQAAFLTLDLRNTDVSSLLEADNRTVERTQFTYSKPTEYEAYTLDTHVVGDFNTGSIKHKLLVGFDLFRQTRRSGIVRTAAAPLDVFNPVYGQPLGDTLGRIDIYYRDDALGFYLQDQVTLANNLKLLVGGRYDLVENESADRIASTTSIQSDSAFSPRVGIVYQPITPVSLYASYSRSFEQVTGAGRDNSLFKPQLGTQYEVGVKTDLFNNKLSATLALYQLTLTNILTTDPIDPDFDVQTGEQRSRGVELSVTGEILPGWNVIGFYGYTNARVTKDNNIPVGNRVEGVPAHVASLWTTYTFGTGSLKGFGGGIGFNYVGDNKPDSSNTFTIPSYFLTDAALYYRNNNFSVGLNLNNIFNVRYYEASFDYLQRIIPGRPYTAELSVKWEL
ncbi:MULTISPECIES: TonB-dependent siderophore receptor [unclassified Nostoc]|uniref:TonB-dependent siderophore receptor n=1 Tax=unclassified Nostoc TaxID=2593658 RepID=UPI0026184FE4|nr:TonB-dependent siderophore receptor [Nostoc sp. S13]MDF5734680.1 TonB-dependent siderophore receptor [Nostoc sp. S13]